MIYFSFLGFIDLCTGTELVPWSGRKIRRKSFLRILRNFMGGLFITHGPVNLMKW